MSSTPNAQPSQDAAAPGETETAEKKAAAAEPVLFEKGPRTGNERGKQLTALRNLILSKGEGVSDTVLKGVLRVLDDHGQRAFISHATIARECPTSIRGSQRALARLKKLDLVAVKPMKFQDGERRTINFLSVNWTEIYRLVDRQQAALKQPESSNIEPPFATDRTAICDRSNRHPRRSKRIGSAMEAPPPHSPEWQNAEEEVRKNFSQAEEITAAAKKLGKTPEQMLDWMREAIATANHPTNAKLLTSPAGAAFNFLKTGHWPTPGVRSIEQLDAERKAAEKRKSDAADAQRQREIDDTKTRAEEERQARVLDAMPDYDRLAFAKRVLSAQWFRTYESDPTDGTARTYLFMELAKKQTAEAAT